MFENPKKMRSATISIIISVLNGQRTLCRCLDSILKQTYTSYEIICIDGGSTDGTTRIIENYLPKLSHFVSEPDSGVYEAWNKALPHVKGDYIMFIGCDDYFYDDNVLANLSRAADRDQSDLITSEILVVNSAGKTLERRGKAWDFNRLKAVCNVVHPGLLHKKQLFEEFGEFNTSYRISADYEFLLRISRPIKSTHLNIVSVCMENSGLSNKYLFRTLFETYKAQLNSEHVANHSAHFNFLASIAKTYVKRTLMALHLIK